MGYAAKLGGKGSGGGEEIALEFFVGGGADTQTSKPAGFYSINKQFVYNLWDKGYKLYFRKATGWYNQSVVYARLWAVKNIENLYFNNGALIIMQVKL